MVLGGVRQNVVLGGVSTDVVLDGVRQNVVLGGVRHTLRQQRSAQRHHNPKRNTTQALCKDVKHLKFGGKFSKTPRSC